MTHRFQDIGVATRIGTYSDAVEVSENLRWLFTSGTPGLPTDGTPLPEGIEAQAELVWRHVIQMVNQAGMSARDIVKVTQYLTRPADIKAYAAVRGKYLGDARPASMLSVVSQLVWPDMLVEVEVIAAKQVERVAAGIA